MPSSSREELRCDIDKSVKSLGDGQALIVSVVGTAPESGTHHDKEVGFIRDFVDIALFAKDCGAAVVEANFSCPNVCSGSGRIFSNPSSVKTISSAITKSLGSTPFIIKVGDYFDSYPGAVADSMMKSVVKAAAESGVSGICAINTLSRKILDKNTNKPSLGKMRPTGGICGGPIRSSAMRQVQELSDFVKSDSSLSERLTILGCGGVTSPSHFDNFLNAGADIAMTASGFMWDPLLAKKYYDSQN